MLLKVMTKSLGKVSVVYSAAIYYCALFSVNLGLSSGNYIQIKGKKNESVIYSNKIVIKS